MNWTESFWAQLKVNGPDVFTSHVKQGGENLNVLWLKYISGDSREEPARLKLSAGFIMTTATSASPLTQEPTAESNP